MMKRLAAVLTAAILTSWVAAPLPAAQAGPSVTLEDIARIFSAPAKMIGYVVAGWRELDEIPNVLWDELPPRITSAGFEREGAAHLQGFGRARLLAAGPRAGITELRVRTETDSENPAGLVVAQFSASTELRRLHLCDNATVWRLTPTARKTIYLTMQHAAPPGGNAIVFNFTHEAPAIEREGDKTKCQEAGDEELLVIPGSWTYARRRWVDKTLPINRLFRSDGAPENPAMPTEHRRRPRMSCA